MSMGPSYTVWNVNCKSIKRSKTLIGNIKLDYYILCTLNLNISLLEVFLYILTLISHIQMFFIFYIHSLLFLYNNNHSILVLGSSTKHSLHFYIVRFSFRPVAIARFSCIRETRELTLILKVTQSKPHRICITWKYFIYDTYC